MMFFEYGKGPNRLLELDGAGKVVWEHIPPSIAVIFQILGNGNVLYAYGGKPTGVREVTRQGKEVWNYASECPQVLGCERLKNGNTLVAEQGPCRAVEVDPQGKVVRVTPLKTRTPSWPRRSASSAVGRQGSGSAKVTLVVAISCGMPPSSWRVVNTVLSCRSANSRQ